MHLMKNITITLLLSVLVAACSSGNTNSDIPQNITSTFQGSFQDNGGPTGNITLNLSDNNQGVVTGNLIVTGNSCLQSGSFSNGTSNGFNVTIPDITQTGVAPADMFEVVTTTTGPDVTNPDGSVTPGAVSISTVIRSTGTPGTQQITQADGTVVTIVTTLIEGGAPTEGTLSFQLAITNNGSTLSGTFVTTGTVCPAGQGSGSVTLNG